MFTVYYAIESGKFKYVKFETENLADARNIITEKSKEYLEKDSYNLVTKNKKGISHYINTHSSEIFKNPNFLFQTNVIDWEIYWIEGPSVNGLAEAKNTVYISYEDINKLQKINFSKLAAEYKLKLFYYKNWRDAYYTEDFSNENEIGEVLPNPIMDSIKRDIHYLKLEYHRNTARNVVTEIYISKDIINDIVLEMLPPTIENGYRFVLKYKNRIIYGTGGNGFDSFEAMQLIDQWKFKISKSYVDKLTKFLCEENTKNSVDYDDLKKKAKLLQCAINIRGIFI